MLYVFSSPFVGAGQVWETSEGSLFVMSAVARNILPTEAEVVPQVLDSVLALPATAHLAVRNTSIRYVDY